MKNFIMILFISVFFISCSQKEKIVDINYLYENPKMDKINNTKEDIEKVEILGLDEFISENEIKSKFNEENTKIAVCYASTIMGKYAKSAVGTILCFYTFKGIDYRIKTFDSIIENKTNMKKVFKRIKEKGYKKVIALYSPKTIGILNEINTDGLEIYLPLVNKDNVSIVKENFIYGGISYIKQIKRLYEYSSSNSVIFNQDSYLGNILKVKFEEIVKNRRFSKKIKNKKNYFKSIAGDSRLTGATLFLNTNIVKTSLILSQLRAYDIIPKVVLSTQQNYKPRILSLTQIRDRKRFVVANSISKVNDNLEDIISNFGGDIQYNWVDYSTLIGVNYFFDKNESFLIKNQIVEQQVNYEVKLYRVSSYGFLEIK